MAGERIDELSKSTLKSAQKGFAKRIAYNSRLAGIRQGEHDTLSKEKKSYNKGVIGDIEKKVEKDVGNIAKAGHRLAGRYYPKYVKEKNKTFGGHRKYKASTSPYTGKEPEARYTRKEEYDMTEEELNEISRAKAQRYEKAAQDTDAPEDDEPTRKQLNRARGMVTASLKASKSKHVRVPATEEYEMDEDELNEISKEKARRYANKAMDTTDPEYTGKNPKTDKRYRSIVTAQLKAAGSKNVRVPATEEYEMNEDEGEEQEVTGPDISDLVLNAIEQKPLDFQQTFAELMQQRIEDAVAERKLEVAAAFTGDDERSQYEAGEDEPEGEEEEEEGEVEEEPEAEEEGEAEE